MEDSKNLEQPEENSEKNISNETLEIKNKTPDTIFNSSNLYNQNKNLNNNLIENRKLKAANEIAPDKTLEVNKKVELTSKLNATIDKSKNNIEKSNNEINERTPEQNKLDDVETSSNIVINKSSVNIDKDNKDLLKEKKLEENKKVILESKSKTTLDKIKNNSSETSTTNPIKANAKPVKKIAIEKKPFLEFVNNHLIPEIKNEFKLKGKEVNKINLQKTHRPIAEDMCWVIYCEVRDTCNFWLSFEKDDITSLKSFSLCKNYEKPSIIESFLIDEKKITLKLIISRILQRLNGQKLIGAN